MAASRWRLFPVAATGFLIHQGGHEGFVLRGKFGPEFVRRLLMPRHDKITAGFRREIAHHRRLDMDALFQGGHSDRQPPLSQERAEFQLAMQAWSSFRWQMKMLVLR